MNVRSHIAVIRPLKEEDLVNGAAANHKQPTADQFRISLATVNSDADLEELYMRKRSELIAKERSLRFDAAKNASLTSDEQKANQIISRIRKAESDTKWDVAHEMHTFSGMPFYQAMDKMHSSALFNVIQKMPKGALLHCHMDATVDSRFLIARAAVTPGMHMRASQPLDSVASLREATIQFMVLPPDTTEVSSDNIYESSYTPLAWVPYTLARATFPYPHIWTLDGDDKVLSHLIPPPTAEVSQEEQQVLAFESYVQSLMTMAPTTSAEAVRNSKQAWAKFLTTFRVIHGLLGYEPNLKEHVKQMCRINARDGVRYVETRINFFLPYMVRANGQHDLTHREWVQIYDEAVTEVRQELRAEGIDFWDARIIYSTVRIIDNATLRLALEDCRALKKEFPHRIVGFDLVGHEDPGTPLKTYLPELLRFKREQSELGLAEIPFILHAGETLGDGNHTDENLFDALLLGTKRIGHGYSLSKHPLLMQLCKEHGILIEVCPISNEILGYTSNVAAHPCTTLLNNGVAVSLSNDDPCQFGNFGLSYDYFKLLVSSHQTQLSSLHVLVRQSIEFAQLDEQEKADALGKFEAEWAQFIEWIIKEHGDSD